MKIGIYGGTFDPIHNGHLILARDAVEKLGLDEIVFVPNSVSPHKYTGKAPPSALRYEMLCAAIAGEPRFKASDIELRRGGISYTIDTVLALKGQYPPGTTICFLVGVDNVRELNSWRKIDELKSLAEFVVLNRKSRDPANPQAQQLGRRIDISATEIRERVAKSESIRYLVPDAVLQIIDRHHLYKESPH